MDKNILKTHLVNGYPDKAIMTTADEHDWNQLEVIQTTELLLWQHFSLVVRRTLTRTKFTSVILAIWKIINRPTGTVDITYFNVEIKHFYGMTENAL